MIQNFQTIRQPLIHFDSQTVSAVLMQWIVESLAEGFVTAFRQIGKDTR